MAADITDWVQRAKAFLRQLTHLPGKLMIQDSIEPPCDDISWLNSPECSLPAEVNEFLRFGSNRCAFSYRWEPPVALQPQLQAILPGEVAVEGGADFCEAARYSNYDNRESLKQLGQSVQEQALQMFDMFPPEIREQMQGLMPAGFLGLDLDDRGDLLQLAPLPDKSQLAFELDPNNEPLGVVLVADDDRTRRKQLCDSFAEFLFQWEQTCYVTPTAALLQPWLDATGKLQPDREKSRQLRALLLSCSRS